MANLVIITFAIISTVSAWDPRGPIIAREEPASYAAWYQMPQSAAAYPPSAYERAVAASAASPYAGYPRPYSRSPDYYPEAAVSNNMVPSGRKASASGYYLAGQNTQDTYQITAIDRYFPLLGRKNRLGGTGRPQQPPKVSSTPKPDAASVMRTLGPRKPFIETWKCARKPCPRTLKPLPLTKGRSRNLKTATPRPSATFRTFATVDGIRLAGVNPYTFRPRHKQSNMKTVKVTLPTTTQKLPKTVPTTAPPTVSATKTTQKILQSTTTALPTKKIQPSTTTTSGSSTLPPTSFTTKTSTTVREVTKRRETKPKKTSKPSLSLIKVTPFTTTTEAPPTTISSSSTNISVNFPYSILWGKSSIISNTSKPQISAAKSSSALKLPLQVVASRIYQLLESQLTSTAIEFEEMQNIKEDIKKRPWITEEEIVARVLERGPQQKPKRKQKIKVVEESYEEEEEEEVTPEPIKKKKRPNAELISAIKDVVRKFKASLDRTGVHEDVRQMSTQLESTWNDLRRGINRSWGAFRQSAETALLSPSLTSASSFQHPLTLLPPPPPPPPGILTSEPFPYIITSHSLKKSFMKDINNHNNNNNNIEENSTTNNLYQENDNNNDNNSDKMMMMSSSNDGHGNSVKAKISKENPFKTLLLSNLFEPVHDSGKLDSWIERAHQMLADSVSEDDVKALLESQKSTSKLAKNPIKSSVVKAEKINPKFEGFQN